ncbi:MAG: DUF2065 family protein [Hyphomonas sp.]|nr:DUF2065 family protein [Hyphomonas sp.]MDP3460803.1 DUF2065 family protein [Hyphomonas sp.]
MSLLTVLLAGIGVWFLAEGAMCALAPDFMRRLAVRLAAIPARDLALLGLGAAAVGALLVTIAVRTA